MLPSMGYFRDINCPFYESGLCERPYCHFRHTKKDISDTNSEPFDNGVILQQLVSEAVKKVLQHSESNSSEKDSDIDSSSLISQVVQELAPSTNKSAPSAAKVTYNPTPISELNKLNPANNEFKPAPSRKEYLNRKHIPVPYTPHRPSRSQSLRLTAKSETSAILSVHKSSEPAELEKYTPIAMECESGVEYLPGSVDKLVPVPYSPISTSGDPILRVAGAGTYTPTDKANIGDYSNVSLYTPSGQGVSGVTYSPGAAVSADYSTSSYCPTSTGYGGLGSRSPCYSSLSYRPTPLTTTNPKFSSDEDDEPQIKKSRGEFQGLEDLDLEFEILGQILEDENDNSKKLVSSITPESTSDIAEQKSEKLQEDDSKIKLLSVKSKDHISLSKSSSSKENSRHSKSEPSKSDHKSDKHSSRHHKTSKSSSRESESVSSSRESHKSSSNRESKKPSSSREILKKSSSSEKKSSRDSEKTSPKKDNNHFKESLKKGDDGRSISKDKEKKHSDSERSKSRSSSSKSEKKSTDSKSTHEHKSSKSTSHSTSSSKHKSHESKKSSSDKKNNINESKSRNSSKHGSTGDSEKRSSKDKIEKKYKDEKYKSDKSTSRSKENTIIIDNSDVEDNHASDFELIEEFSDSDEEKITQECLKIFEEYVPVAKEVPGPQNINKDTIPKVDNLAGKKRVAHLTNQTIYRSPSTILPDHKAKALQLATDRYSKVKQFHESRLKRAHSDNTQVQLPVPREEPSVSAASSVSSSKVRIAHVPNVSTLLYAKKNLKVSEPPKPTTVVQTVSKGTSRVAHMPNDKFSERPGVLEPLASKIPVNIRSKYLNLMIDECLKIYLTSEDAYARAQQEELSTNKKCTAIPIYKNSAVLTISRLRKEIQEAGGVRINRSDVGQSSISHNKVLLGKLAEKSSWSIENKYKKDGDFSIEFKGVRFYENISQWILTEEELRDNGFPRSHPERKEKGIAKIFTQNTRQKPQKGFIRICCRCKKEYTVDKKGVAIAIEECIYHPNNKYRFRGEVKYQCCGQDMSSDGCLSASCHVYEYVDHDNLRGFVKTLPKDSKSGNSDYGVYALDCEMCYTTNGLDLTRVTVIDNTLKVVYESLVKPFYPIIDYNTRYSGLTEEHMKDVSTTLLEVQATFLHMFSDKTILVGHSLESDFKALKLIHNTVVDTSVLFPHKMGPPYKRALRNLSSEFLKKIIQNSLDGHDSAEDATVCMELLIWKLKEELKTR